MRNPATTGALAAAPHHLAATASGVMWTLQNASGALSIAIAVTLFRSLYLTDSTSQSFLVGYRAVMCLLAIVVFATFVTIGWAMKK